MVGKRGSCNYCIGGIRNQEPQKFVGFLTGLIILKYENIIKKCLKHLNTIYTETVGHRYLARLTENNLFGSDLSQIKPHYKTLTNVFVSALISRTPICNVQHKQLSNLLEQTKFFILFGRKPINRSHFIEKSYKPGRSFLLTLITFEHNSIFD